MSVECIECGDVSSGDKLNVSDQYNDSEKARESQGRVNHSQHYYGSSIE